jgi:hypothetical protein
VLRNALDQQALASIEAGQKILENLRTSEVANPDATKAIQDVVELVGHR